MRRRIAALLSFLSAIMITALLPMASLAGVSNDVPPLIYQAPSAVNVPPELAGSNQPVTVMVELVLPATISAPTEADADVLSQRIAADQATLLQQLAALNAQVLFQARVAYNGIAITIARDKLEQVRTLPKVAAIHIIPPKQRAEAPAVPSTATFGRFLHRRLFSSATGLGVRMGIIDSGIDYTHADFAGPGTAAAYTANNPTVIEPGSFPTLKVGGGYDFAGNAYDATGTLGNPVPAPDPDPLDCNGHGTHVAGTAAGLGVTAEGRTYLGPYNSGVDFSNFLVSPGVAPGARLYALKIFGCQGSSVLMTQAVEWALDPNGDGNPRDRLDILNISLGTPFGSADDPDAVAVDNAVRSGVVVVTAVGDTGNTFYSTNSPASGQRAIAVGASQGAPAGSVDLLASFSARGPTRGNNALTPTLVAPGIDISSAAMGTGTNAKTMSGTAMASPQVAGAAALLRQLRPRWTPEQIKAALMNTATPVEVQPGVPAPPSLGGAGRLDTSRFAGLDLLAYVDNRDDQIALMFGAPQISQPWEDSRVLRLDNRSDAVRVVSLSATTTVSETGVTLQLPTEPITLPPHTQVNVPIGVVVQPGALDSTPDAATPPQQDLFWRYALPEHGGEIVVSRGGVRVRPAHAAHFGDIDFYLDDQLLDDSLDSREVQEYSDTTAGRHTVRLVRPSHGHGSQGREILTTDVQFVEGHDYTLVVVGRPDALGVLVVDDTTPGLPAPGQSLIHFVNANRTEPNWDIGPLDIYLDGVRQVSGLAVGQTSEYISISPGPHLVVFFKAGTDPLRSRRVAHKIVIAAPNEVLLVGTGRHDDNDGKIDDDEQRAFIGRDVGRPGLPAVHIPFDIFPKAASESRAATASINVPAAGRAFTVSINNTGARNTGLNGFLAGPQTPLASAFELAASSPAIGQLRPSLRAADIQYLGVTSNYSVTQNIAATALFFGISTHGPWSTPNEVEFLVYIDSNLDGVDDYLMLNTNGSVFSGKPSDAFISPLYRILPDGTILPASTYSSWGTWQPPQSPQGYGFDLSPFNTSVMFQAAGATAIGLTPGQTRIRYHLETRARDADRFGQIVDRVPAQGKLEYDVAHPAIMPVNVSTSLLIQRPIFVDVNGGQITGGIDPGTLAVRGSQQLLILHHHNLPGQQAEVVTIQGNGLVQQSKTYAGFTTFLPLVIGAR